MNATDLDAPKMIYTGPLPSHLLRVEEPPPVEDPFEAWADALPQRRSGFAVVAALGVTLAAGIAIGASVPPLLGLAWIAPTKVAAAEPPHALRTSVPLPTPVAVQPPPVPPTVIALRNEAPAAIAPRAAVALLAPASKPIHAAAEKPKAVAPAPRRAVAAVAPGQADEIGSLLLHEALADEPPH